jgi:peptidoglycan/LPS O-acetylase OafA/YrhL
MIITSYPINIWAGFITIYLCILTAQVIIRLGAKVSFNIQPRLGCVDGLRGFLALCVFLHHYLKGVNHSTRYTLLAQVSVVLFFMITGFLFGYKILSSQGRVNWIQLYLSRMFRLVPMYWFVIILILMIVFIKSGLTLHVPITLLIEQLLSWLSFLGTPDINNFEKTSSIIRNVTWTLRFEWMFYLSLPFIAVVLKISSKFPLILWLAVGVIVIITMQSFFIPAYFLVGIFSAFLYKIEFYRSLAQNKVMSLLSLISLLLLFLLFSTAYGKAQILFISFFFIPIALGNSLFGLLRFPAVVLLGEISYSIYLLHGLLLYVCFSMLFPTVMSYSYGS